MLNESPRVRFAPNTQYQIVSINAEQFDLAKDISSRVQKTHAAHTAGDGP